MSFIPAAALATLVFASAPAFAADVQVSVATVGSPQGVVRAQVCRATEWLKDGCALEGVAKAEPGTTIVTVHDVPPGVYAVVAWHDKKNDDTVARSLLGIPEEGVGFSNNPRLGLHGPRFGDAAIKVGAQGADVAVRLRFEQ